MVSEPINLKQWSAPKAARRRGRLFTCGRPGRATFGPGQATVDEATIDLWVKGLPPEEVLHIVSLLGSKKSGRSEFSYYPFRSVHESGSKPTFQEWLNERHDRRFVVHEFPTVDAQGIRTDVLQKVTRHLLKLLNCASTIVVIDSAGAERTARVCEKIGFKPNDTEPAIQQPHPTDT